MSIWKFGIGCPIISRQGFRRAPKRPLSTVGRGFSSPIHIFMHKTLHIVTVRRSPPDGRMQAALLRLFPIS